MYLDISNVVSHFMAWDLVLKEFYNTKIKSSELKGQFQVNDPCH